MTDPAKSRRRSKPRKDAHDAADSGQAAAPATSSAPNALAPDPIDADTLDGAFVKALEADFIANGKSAIVALRSEKPVEYMKIVAAVRTKDANAIDPWRKMSDAELDRRLQELATQAGWEIRPVATPRREGATDEGANAD
jgi:hypothetical protein